MAEDLQGLLDRINQEGVKKIEAEKEKILAEARAQAKQVVAKAREEAEALVNDARQESAKLVQAGEDKLRQASRDVKVALAQELKHQLNGLVRQATVATLQPSFLGDLIIELAKAYGERQGRVTKVDVLVPEARREALGEYLLAKLGDQFREGVTIKPIAGIDAGIQVSFNGESVFHDFTGDAITDMLAAYANPRIAALLRSEGNKD